MKHLAAYLLLSLNGGSPSESDVKKLLSSVGIEADDERLSKLFSELEGKDINEVTYLLWNRRTEFIVNPNRCWQTFFCSIRWCRWCCFVICYCRWRRRC